MIGKYLSELKVLGIHAIVCYTQGDLDPVINAIYNVGIYGGEYTWLWGSNALFQYITVSPQAFTVIEGMLTLGRVLQPDTAGVARIAQFRANYVAHNFTRSATPYDSDSFAYDAALVLADALVRLKADGGDPSDGAALMSYIRTADIEGIAGRVWFLPDSNERHGLLPRYDIYQQHWDNDTLQRQDPATLVGVAYPVIASEDFAITWYGTVRWQSSEHGALRPPSACPLGSYRRVLLPTDKYWSMSKGLGWMDG